MYCGYFGAEISAPLFFFGGDIMIMSYILVFIKELFPLCIFLVALKSCMDITRGLLYGRSN